jgi:hypothetical protein
VRATDQQQQVHLLGLITCNLPRSSGPNYELIWLSTAILQGFELLGPKENPAIATRSLEVEGVPKATGDQMRRYPSPRGDPTRKESPESAMGLIWDCCQVQVQKGIQNSKEYPELHGTQGLTINLTEGRMKGMGVHKDGVKRT